MIKCYRINTDNDEAGLQKSLFSPLLEKNLVAGLMLPRKTQRAASLTTLMRKKQSLEEVTVVNPLMLVSEAQNVSKLTFKGTKERIGALLRPCEIRALIELEKLKQCELDKVLIIGTDCLGTMEIDTYKKAYAKKEEEFNNEWKTMLKEGHIRDEYQLREACLYCQFPSYEKADINLCWIGNNREDLLLTAHTKRGTDILDALGLEKGELPAERETLIQAVKEKNADRWEKEMASFSKQVGDFTEFQDLFEYCKRCYNCRIACPICYCRECVFQTLVFEHGAEKYIKWMKRKGTIRMPPDTMLFHLTRLNHMGLSCITCGLCESACPSDIPLLKIFKLIGDKAQDFFSYQPGNDTSEPMPLTTFCEEELEPR